MKATVRLVRQPSRFDKKERIDIEIADGGWIVMPNSLNLVAGDELEIDFTLIPKAEEVTR